MEKDSTKQKGLTSLPTETLQLLVSFTSPRQRFTLLHVCRALSLPCFWRSLYTNIHISNAVLCDKFLDTITESAKGNTFIHHLGQFVETVILFTNCLTKNKQAIATLQPLCPNMIYFDRSRQGDLDPGTLSEAFPWKHIQRIYSSLYSDVALVAQHAHDQLTHLSLFNLSLDDGTPIFGSLSFPHLVDLIIETFDFSIDMLTGIISSCPALHHLTLVGVILLDRHDDGGGGGGGDWDAITPSVSIKHLELQHVHNAKLSWLKVFGRAFPMVETLTINHLDIYAAVPVMGDDTIQINNSDDERDFMEAQFEVADLRTAVLTMLDAFTHLVRAQLLYIDYNGENLGGYFLLEHWIAHGKQLEDIQFDYSVKDNGSLEDSTFIDYEVRGDPHDDFSDYEYGSQLAAMGDQQSAIVVDFINSNQQSLRTFHFYVNHALLDSQGTILNTLATCTRLHTLVLRFTGDMCGYYDLETINTILDTLPNLKSLEYPMELASEPEVIRSYLDDEWNVADSRSVHRKPIAPHGLTRLVYNGEIRTLGFLAYIHKRCPHLSELHLDARRMGNEGCLLVKFPKWNLKLLDLGSFDDNNSMKSPLVLVLEIAYTPTRERWYRSTTYSGWHLCLDIPTNDAYIDVSPGASHSPSLVIGFNSVEEIRIFTPSHNHYEI